MQCEINKHIQSLEKHATDVCLENDFNIHEEILLVWSGHDFHIHGRCEAVAWILAWYPTRPTVPRNSTGFPHSQTDFVWSPSKSKIGGAIKPDAQKKHFPQNWL